jgi:MraZ protein
MNFYGLYIRKIDEPSRVTLPPTFRQGLREELALLVSPKAKCLECGPSSLLTDQRLITAGKRGVPSYTSETNVRLRFMDKRGRVNIPQYFRKHAEISHSVVIVGMGRYLELWSEKNWQTEDSWRR